MGYDEGVRVCDDEGVRMRVQVRVRICDGVEDALVCRCEEEESRAHTVA